MSRSLYTTASCFILCRLRSLIPDNSLLENRLGRTQTIREFVRLWLLARLLSRRDSLMVSALVPGSHLCPGSNAVTNFTNFTIFRFSCICNKICDFFVKLYNKFYDFS